MAEDECRRFGRYFTLCGEWVPADDLPDPEYPPDCEGSPYCEECTRVAAEAVGVLADRAGVAR